ncbi:tetratricopeptide repeat protein [Ideonella sp. A 288]|uniref:tetratricopeptide repeat protein n=1 Tax=Ideonella sp. A 288 TaxID=1962181 RepID=UPI000B4A9C44|nr:tetratricopeptide repeat protein [Ideonella sp. A 288]
MTFQTGAGNDLRPETDRLPRRAWGGWTWRRMLALAVLAGGALLVAQSPPPPALEPTNHSKEKSAAELRQRFDQAVVMLHAKEYDHAAAALQRVLQLAPRMPEAHVNMGFAMLGLQRGGEAVVAFERAIDLQSTQANAYYGLAMALELQGDLPAALGAMRSYLHLSSKDERFHAKARAALWEWEQRLGRHGPATTPPPAPSPR